MYHDLNLNKRRAKTPPESNASMNLNTPLELYKPCNTKVDKTEIIMHAFKHKHHIQSIYLPTKLCMFLFPRHKYFSPPLTTSKTSRESRKINIK